MGFHPLIFEVIRYKETLERVKWTLWHGGPDEALAKLHLLMTTVTDAKKRSQLEGLYDYLERNKVYLVHYEEPVSYTHLTLPTILRV